MLTGELREVARGQQLQQRSMIIQYYQLACLTIWWLFSLVVAPDNEGTEFILAFGSNHLMRGGRLEVL